MSINFGTLQGLTIPEGVVTQITDAAGRVLWSAVKNIPAVLQVEKITADTYAGETTYKGEQFVLLDIYPKKAGSTVEVTYGNLTKTLNFDGTNSQPVFFGTFNGVSDGVSTPSSGTLTIDGDYSGFACGSYASSSKSSSVRCWCVTEVVDWGCSTSIKSSAFGDVLATTNTRLVDIAAFPNSIKVINTYAFAKCTGLKRVTINGGVHTIYGAAFQSCDNLESVTIGDQVKSIYGGAFSQCNSLSNLVVDANSEEYSTESGVLFNKDKTLLHCYPSANGEYVIPNTVKTIEAYAFYRNTNLTSVTIPAGVTSIGKYAFNLPSGSSRIVKMLSVMPATLGGDAVFDNVGTNEIIVPAGSGEAYKAAEYWSEYADYITEA